MSSIVASLISLVFFTVGAFGWFTIHLDKLRWSVIVVQYVDYYSSSYSFSDYLGLRGELVVYKDSSVEIGEPYEYGSFKCGSDNTIYECKCGIAGIATFSLVLISSLSTVILLSLTIKQLLSESAVTSRIYIIVPAFLAFILSMAAFTNWHVNCFLIAKLHYETWFDTTASESTGFYLVIVGWISSFANLLLQVFIPLKHDGSVKNQITLSSDDALDVSNNPESVTPNVGESTFFSQKKVPLAAQSELSSSFNNSHNRNLPASVHRQSPLVLSTSLEKDQHNNQLDVTAQTQQNIPMVKINTTTGKKQLESNDTAKLPSAPIYPEAEAWYYEVW